MFLCFHPPYISTKTIWLLHWHRKSSTHALKLFRFDLVMYFSSDLKCEQSNVTVDARSYLKVHFTFSFSPILKNKRFMRICCWSSKKHKNSEHYLPSLNIKSLPFVSYTKKRSSMLKEPSKTLSDYINPYVKCFFYWESGLFNALLIF